MALLTTVWSTDEDLYVRSLTDFPLLAAASGVLAKASDGQVQPGDLWTLSSASVDFAAYGIRAGQIVYLTGPVSAFKSPGQCWVAGSVGPSGVTLRRPKAAASVGAHPVSAALTGIVFQVLTMGPQIENASYRINRIFGVDPSVTGRSPTDLYDARQLEEATSYRALADAYWALSRQENGDDFKAKARFYNEQATAAEDRINLIWSANNRPQQQTSKFNMRITR